MEILAEACTSKNPDVYPPLPPFVTFPSASEEPPPAPVYLEVWQDCRQYNFYNSVTVQE